jgi:hypothetical protein
MSALRKAPAALIPGAAVMGLVWLTGCNGFQKAANTPDMPEIVTVVESVLKERFYQTRSYATSGHVFAYSTIELEGSYPVYRRVDVHVFPENTGHYMPRVSVRKFIDISEPPLETGDHSSHFNYAGNAVVKPRWMPYYFDRQMEEEIRLAILKKLNIPV